MLRSVLAFLCIALTLAVPAAAAAAERYGLSRNENIRFLADMAQRPGMQKLDNGVLYRVQATGSGEAVTGRGDKVTVGYTGYLINGTRFDQTPSGKPRSFIVSRVIPGWTEALLKMREGDRWEVIVPAELAYGDGSSGGVPPGQSLLFIIQLEHVEHPS